MTIPAFFLEKLSDCRGKHSPHKVWRLAQLQKQKPNHTATAVAGTCGAGTRIKGAVQRSRICKICIRIPLNLRPNTHLCVYKMGHRELPGKEQVPGCWELNNNQGPHGPGRHLSANQSWWKHFVEQPGHLVENPRKAMLMEPSNNHLSSPAQKKLKNKPGKNHADSQEH